MNYVTSIIDYLTNIASQHQVVKQSGAGTLFDLNAIMNKLYPIVWYDVDSISVDTRTNSYAIRMVVAERLYKDTSTNIYDALAITQAIANDIITTIRRDTTNNLTITNITMNDFRDEFQDDMVAGWVVSFTITTPMAIDKCGIPYAVYPAIIIADDYSPIIISE